MALGMHFDNFGHLCDFFPGLVVYLGIYVELGEEFLDIYLILDVYKARLEFLGEGRLIVAVYLAWWISDSSVAW